MSHVQVIHARWVIPMTASAEEVNASAGGKAAWLDAHSLVIGHDGKIAGLAATGSADLDEIVARAEASAGKDAVGKTVVTDVSANGVVLPGLVNAHSHVSMALLRGFSDEVPLAEWLTHYMWPAEGKFASEDFVRSGWELGAAEMLRSGVTTVNDMYFFPEVAAEAAERCGLRACIGGPLLQFPTPYASGPDEYMAKALAFEEKYRDHRLVTPVLAPHAPYSVGDELFRRVAEESERLGLVVHTHLHETKKEVDDHVAAPEHGEKRPFARMEDLGLVNDRFLCAHMTQTTDEERSRAAAAGMHVVTCPESNMKLRSGYCDVGKLLQAGVNVCLGTDGAASNDDLDMFGELRTAALVDKMNTSVQNRSPVTTYEWLQIATVNGARALGLADRIGSLEVGKDADMIVVEMICEPVYNPVTNLVGVGTNRVSHTWVAGRQVVKDSKVISVPLEDLVSQARSWGQRISEWDKERRTVDVAELQDLLDRSAAVTDDAQQVTRTIQELESRKSLLFHQKFFAEHGNLHCRTPPQVLKHHEEEIDARLARLQEQNK